ncbi:hypothetical protein AVEN_205369-1, partial [Araneus ventricosus]
RLARLCESVSEALKQVEESPSPAPVAPKRPSLLRKIVGKSKSKSHQASPTSEKALSPVQANNTSTMKRAVSESDLTGTKLEDTDLPFRAFESQISTDSQRQSQNEPKKQNHVPLEDLLKNMKMGDRQRHQHHRRGVSEGGKIVYEIDKHTKYLQVRNKKEKGKGPPFTHGNHYFQTQSATDQEHLTYGAHRHKFHHRRWGPLARYKIVIVPPKEFEYADENLPTYVAASHPKTRSAPRRGIMIGKGDHCHSQTLSGLTHQKFPSGCPLEEGRQWAPVRSADNLEHFSLRPVQEIKNDFKQYTEGQTLKFQKLSCLNSENQRLQELPFY